MVNSYALVGIVSAVLISGCSLRPSDQEGVQSEGLSPTEWASLSQPGPSHNLLNLFAGSWDVTIKFWSSPDGEPQESRGSSQLSWILGGRFLKEDFDGEALGERYQGLGIFGYDSGARLFTTVWLDSLNTALALQKGHYLAEQNKFELTGEVYDPLLGRTKTTRSAIRVISHDNYELTMTDTAPNGAEFRSLEIRYARKS